MGITLTKEDKEEFTRLLQIGREPGYAYFAKIARDLRIDAMTPGRLKGVADYTSTFAMGSYNDYDNEEFGYADFHLLKAIADRDYSSLPDTPTGWNDRFFLAHFLALGKERRKESANKLVCNAMAGYYEHVTERGFQVNRLLNCYIRTTPEYNKSADENANNRFMDDPYNNEPPQIYYFLNTQDIRNVARFCRLPDQDLAEDAKFVLGHRNLGLSERQEDSIMKEFLPEHLRDEKAKGLIKAIMHEREWKRDIEELNARLAEWGGSMGVRFGNIF